MSDAFQPRTFGATGQPVSPIGLGSSYGLGARGVERAFDDGVRFFLWGSARRRDFGLGLRNVAARSREDAVIAIQTYTRAASLMRFSVERALRFLRTDYVDVLGLAWWNGAPPPRIVEAALRLRDAGKVRHLMISSHHRPYFEEAIVQPAFDSIMVRYNAAHPGAEREVFPMLERRRVGVLAFTATRWGTLLDPKYLPAGEPAPRASDCYRFALTSPNVDVCLAGPRDESELDEALAAMARGSMDEEELAWMRRVGSVVRERTKAQGRGVAMSVLDRAARLFTCTSPPPKQLTAG
jgi:aryl-alcohol dehydrogenase-like predicted oxidoreductase